MKKYIRLSSEPNEPDYEKGELVQEILARAEKVRDYFAGYNYNLNSDQIQYLEDLSDGIDSQSISAIHEAINNLKPTTGNMHNEQYWLIEKFYSDFNYPRGKYWGIGNPGDDIDACDKVTASTDTSSIVNKIYSVMMNYEYGYDPDMTDINSMLQELTGMGVHVDNSRAFKKAWVSAHNKAERKTWGSSGDAYHYDSLTPRELEAIENYDTEYWEYVKDHPFNLKPASITSSTDTKYFANMVSASSFDSAYDENDNLYQFHVAGYLGNDYRGLMAEWYTNDFEEALEHASDMGGQGLFVEIENQVDGRSRKLTPEEWEDAAKWGEYPDHIREDLAL